MNQTFTIKDDEAVSLAGVTASSLSGPAAREASVIQFPFQSRAAASLALEDASDPVEGFESIGSLAVRLVADWSLPRLVVMAFTGREEPWQPSRAQTPVLGGVEGVGDFEYSGK